MVEPVELKKMTAHDYEDMLQVGFITSILNLTNIIHVVRYTHFDGLLPEPHNTYVLKLLFELAHWHGLAKLRMHTDATLDILSPVTTSLGNSLRTFEERHAQHMTLESWNASGLLGNGVRRNPRLMWRPTQEDLWHPAVMHGSRRNLI